MKLGRRRRRRSSPKTQRQLEGECRSPQDVVLEVGVELDYDVFAKICGLFVAVDFAVEGRRKVAVMRKFGFC